MHMRRVLREAGSSSHQASRNNRAQMRCRIKGEFSGAPL
jgi:hypothetical protein